MRIAVWAAAIGLLLGACNSDPESQPLPEPVEVETCEGLVPVGVIYVERMALALQGLPLDVLTGDADPPADVAALIDLGVELDERAARLECDVDALNAAIVEETAELDGGGDPVTEMFLEIVRGGVIAPLPPPPPTTAPPTTVGS